LQGLKSEPGAEPPSPLTLTTGSVFMPTPLTRNDEICSGRRLFLGNQQRPAFSAGQGGVALANPNFAGFPLFMRTCTV